ncbi:hypothetical protein BDN70DRAFT_901602 [Pholiota conissans]|uniref:Myosin heavy chain n=1 Tax=Pholiota conissans TaxID=109636 RepID=A0A9P6CLX3_9AGAR|nr:hypothetical protein BDN70DRAFT_901602 [Pholiota conissans]
MSSLFAVSKFLGGRSRERRRQDSTSSLVSGSTDSIASRGAPKNPPFKLSNLGGPEWTPSLKFQFYFGFFIFSSFAGPISAEETLHQSEAQDAEDTRNRVQKRIQELEEERDQALVHARDAREAQEKGQTRIQELENTLKSVEAELSSKAKTLDALTTSSDGLRMQIDILKVDLKKAKSISKNVEEERDRVREAEQQRDNLDKYARNMEEERDKAILSAQDAHVKAQARIQDLEEELSSKSQTFNALTATSNGLESQIDALTIDLHNILAVRKGVEDERDSALIRARDLGDAHEKAQAQNHALEEALQYAKTEDSEKSRTIDNLSVASKGLQSQIDALKLNLNDALVLSKLREDERDAALNHLREANKAQATVQEHVQELENGLKSTKDDLTSKSQALEALTANSKAQKAEIDTMKSNPRDALAFGKDVAMERDSALTRVRESEDRRENAQAQIQSLKNALQSTKAELNSKSQAVDALTIGSKGLQLEIDALKVAHRDALDAWTRREVERDAALIQAQVHIQELKDTLKAIKARVSKYFILTGIVSIIAALVDAVV